MTNVVTGQLGLPLVNPTTGMITPQWQSIFATLFNTDILFAGFVNPVTINSTSATLIQSVQIPSALFTQGLGFEVLTGCTLGAGTGVLTFTLVTSSGTINLQSSVHVSGASWATGRLTCVNLSNGNKAFIMGELLENLTGSSSGNSFPYTNTYNTGIAIGDPMTLNIYGNTTSGSQHFQCNFCVVKSV